MEVFDIQNRKWLSALPKNLTHEKVEEIIGKIPNKLVGDKYLIIEGNVDLAKKTQIEALLD